MIGFRCDFSFVEAAARDRGDPTFRDAGCARACPAATLGRFALASAARAVPLRLTFVASLLTGLARAGRLIFFLAALRPEPPTLLEALCVVLWEEDLRIRALDRVALVTGQPAFTA